MCAETIRLLPAFGVGSALSNDYNATGIPTKGRGTKGVIAMQTPPPTPTPLTPLSTELK